MKNNFDFQMDNSKTLEENVCLSCINMHINEATRFIREKGLTDRVVWKDGRDIPKTDSCYISSRINLKVRKGWVVSAQIG